MECAGRLLSDHPHSPLSTLQYLISRARGQDLSFFSTSLSPPVLYTLSAIPPRPLMLSLLQAPGSCAKAPPPSRFLRDIPERLLQRAERECAETASQDLLHHQLHRNSGSRGGLVDATGEASGGEPSAAASASTWVLEAQGRKPREATAQGGAWRTFIKNPFKSVER